MLLNNLALNVSASTIATAQALMLSASKKPASHTFTFPKNSLVLVEGTQREAIEKSDLK